MHAKCPERQPVKTILKRFNVHHGRQRQEPILVKADREIKDGGFRYVGTSPGLTLGICVSKCSRRALASYIRFFTGYRPFKMNRHYVPCTGGGSTAGLYESLTFAVVLSWYIPDAFAYSLTYGVLTFQQVPGKGSSVVIVGSTASVDTEPKI